MTCGNCNNQVAARVRVWFEGTTKREACDECGGIPPVWMPDVFLGGTGGHEMTDENLCNPKTGVPIPFSTKREKAAIMRMLNVRQADSAEKQHGARNERKRRTYFI